MTSRERYLKTLLFGAPDKIPFEPGEPRDKTLKRWHEEGLPAWSRWVSESKQAGVPLFDMDSDGRTEELIPIWIEAGLNVCDPLEVAAGCDINACRKQFRHAIAYCQGIDKRCIAEGGKAIEDDLARVSAVVKDGGYIPGCDHGVPFDISWLNFVNYSALLAELTGWV